MIHSLGQWCSHITSLARDLPRSPLLIRLDVMGRGSLLMIRQPDHIVAFDAERHQHLALPAQPVDFIEYLAPGQIGKMFRQCVQVAPRMRLTSPRMRLVRGFFEAMIRSSLFR